MINTIICGALGKMGAEITGELTASREFKLSGAVEAPGHPGLGKKLGGISVTSSLEDIISNTDAVIDFTAPSAALVHTEACLLAGKPIVIGTTGFTLSQREQIEKASDNIPVLLSPNMSSGINLMLRLAAQAARSLSGFDIEITEIHHNRKKDAPSGTAANIAEKLKKIRKGSRLVYGREGEAGPRNKNEIGIHSLRGGDVTGEHSVIFSGPGERFEITHRAHSRRAFVSGTLSAVKYIVSKPPGLYSMEDLFELK
ncbi:MAG: 4-hydroxy-tetrahydrodipicolinate reductase [Candidatus Krumholzibacteriota bacterium]|nr:4-hydroxy-tetrahydrodipicolinate reductase [Candidatus Krumholzibacteriota bacterium]